MSLTKYNLLKDSWPVLDQALPLSDEVYSIIKDANNGAIINNFLGHLTLGQFYIHTSLLESHTTQRELEEKHVGSLCKDFTERGIFRSQFVGVVIGNGDGWNMMKNNGPTPFMINLTSPHLSRLSKYSGGPIAQVIRGGHRTEAIKKYAKKQNQPEENYWLYTVLILGMYQDLLALFYC